MTVLRVPALPIEPLPGGTALNDSLLWHGVWKELARFAADGPTVLGDRRAKPTGACRARPAAGNCQPV